MVKISPSFLRVNQFANWLKKTKAHGSKFPAQFSVSTLALAVLASMIALKGSLGLRSKQVKRRELDWVGHVFQKYCPLAKVRIDEGLPWQSLVSQAKLAVHSKTTRQEYMRLVFNLVSHFNDPHTVVTFKTSRGMKDRHIPLTCYLCEEKLYVKEVLAPTIDVQAHDLIVEIDGVPALEALKRRVESSLGNWDQPWVQRHTAHGFFYRPASHETEVNLKPVTLKLLPHAQKAHRMLTLDWVRERGRLPLIEDDRILMPLPQWDEPRETVRLNNCTADWIPFGEGAMIGYLRLREMEDLDAEKIGELIERLNTSTDLLVIDLRCNGGGGVCWISILSSMLNVRSASSYPMMMTLDSHIVEEAKEQIELLQNMITKAADKFVDRPECRDIIQFFEQHIKKFEFIVDQGNQNKMITSRFTENNSLPSSFSKTYTHPLIILINEETMSTAEYIAALLQDHVKAVIFGTNSAGGGGGTNGNFNGCEPLVGPHLIDKLKFPTFLHFRPSGGSLCNFTVVPDVQCSMTPGDYANEAPQFGKRLNELIRQTLENRLVSKAEAEKSWTNDVMKTTA